MPSMLSRLQSRARSFKAETYALYLAARDPRTPWAARVLVFLVAAYALRPIDLIPDFIPVPGYLDNLLIVPAGIALALRMIPAEVMQESRASPYFYFRHKGRHPWSIDDGPDLDIGYNHVRILYPYSIEEAVMNLITRGATSADKPEWLRMRTALWPDESPADLGQELDAILDDHQTPVFVLERPGGGLGGFLEAGIRKYAEGCVTSPVGYIEGWYVDEDLRRQGFGHQLVKAAEDWARSQGLREMGSDTWLNNEASIRAHMAMGYREAERLVHFARTL